MRAYEFLIERDKIGDNQAKATPGLRAYDNLDNSSPYAPWRFSAYYLAGADGKNPYHHKPNKEGPIGQALTLSAYTKEESDMIRQAENEFGSEASARQVTPMGSTETDDTHKISPVKGHPGYSTKNKKSKSKKNK